MDTNTKRKIIEDKIKTKRLEISKDCLEKYKDESGLPEIETFKIATLDELMSIIASECIDMDKLYIKIDNILDDITQFAYDAMFEISSENIYWAL